MTFFRLPKAACVAAALFLGAAPHAVAQTLDLRVSSDAPQTASNAIILQSFVTELQTRLGDAVKIDFYHSGTLGNEQVHIDMVRGGQIDVYSIGADAMSLEEKTAFFEMPFLLQDADAVVRILDNEEIKGELFASFRQKTGLQPLAFSTLGFRHFTSSRGPIVEPKDLAGMKMRVPGSSQRMKTWEFFGASPVTISTGELYVALANRTVDGQEQSLAAIMARSLQEVQGFLSLSNYLYGPALIVMNGATYDRLADEQRVAVLEAAVAAAQANRDRMDREDATYLETLRGSLKVNEVNTEAFIEHVQPLWTSIVENSPEREFLQKVVDMALQK